MGRVRTPYFICTLPRTRLLTIHSETQEVEQRGSRIEQVPGAQASHGNGTLAKGRAFRYEWGRMTWVS